VCWFLLERIASGQRDITRSSSLKGETNLKYQISIFGDFSHISPNEDTLKLCIENFFSIGMLPGSSIQEVDARTNRLEPRLSLQSIKNGVVANFLNGRIDFIAIPISGSPAAALTVKDFVLHVSNVLRIASDVLGVVYNRIGFVTEKFLRELSIDEFTRVRGKFFKDEAVLFPELDNNEWHVRMCSVDDLEAPLSQGVNVTYNLARAHVQIADQSGQREFDTVHLVVDINTPADKRINGSAESLEQFLQFAQEKEVVIQSKIGSMVYE